MASCIIAIYCKRAIMSARNAPCGQGRWHVYIYSERNGPAVVTTWQYAYPLLSEVRSNQESKWWRPGGDYANIRDSINGP